MKLVFPTTFDYPTRFAHPIHGLHMARALAKILGSDFLFTHGQVLDGSLLSGISTQSILGKKPRWVKKLRFRRIAALWWFVRFLLCNRNTRPVFYVIDRTLASLLIVLKLFFRFSVVFEYHAFYYNWLDRMILRNVDALIFLTHALREKAHQWVSFAQDAIVLPEGIALEPFQRIEQISVAQLREELPLPNEKMIIGYIGRFRPLGMDKGIETLIEASGLLSRDIVLYCIGGTEDEIAFYEARAKARGLESRIVFLPFQDPERIPRYARAFDMLAYVPPANDFFSYYTSPMKLFEYMATRKPIIVSDLPAFREILSEEEAWFVKAGDAREFMRAVLRLRGERPEAIRMKTSRAYEKVRRYAWDIRARRVIELCANL